MQPTIEENDHCLRASHLIRGARETVISTVRYSSGKSITEQIASDTNVHIIKYLKSPQTAAFLIYIPFAGHQQGELPLNTLLM